MVWEDLPVGNSLRNAHEEADAITIHQMLSIVGSSINDININFISDDTDVSVLLGHFYRNRQHTCRVTMEQHPKN